MSAPLSRPAFGPSLVRSPSGPHATGISTRDCSWVFRTSLTNNFDNTTVNDGWARAVSWSDRGPDRDGYRARRGREPPASAWLLFVDLVRTLTAPCPCSTAASLPWLLLFLEYESWPRAVGLKFMSSTAASFLVVDHPEKSDELKVSPTPSAPQEPRNTEQPLSVGQGLADHACGVVP